MAAARELPLQLARAAEQMPPRYDALYGLLVLLAASVVVWSVAGNGNGKPPAAHAGYALAGFLLWLVGTALLLSPRARHPMFPGAMAAAAAAIANNSAVEKQKQKQFFLVNRQLPAPV